MSQQTESNAVRLTQPGAGQTVNVPIDADNMRLSLGFAPDPNAVEKNGQNLEFSFEDGGKLVLEGYYDHFADKTLPVMVTEDGEELPGEDFLASLREDLLTAAGPGAGAGAAGSGAGEYTDDAGALIDGIGRLGSLGTMYWAYASEVPEEFSGEPERPGGAFTLAVLSPSADNPGLFNVGIFEDWQPNQHQGDYETESAAKIEFNFVPTGSTVVTGVELSGFTAGTEIYIGYGSDPIIISGPDQVVPFTYDQLMNVGVYVKAPANNDADMNMTANVYLEATSSGIPGQFTDTFTIVVDAVADLPVIQLEMDDDGNAVMVDVTPKEDQLQDAGDSKLGSTEATAIDLAVSATFGDLDGSELHYFIVEGVPSGWEMITDTLPEGWSLVGPDDPRYPVDYEGEGWVVIVPGDQSPVEGTIQFNPGDWSNSRDTEGNLHPLIDPDTGEQMVDSSTGEPLYGSVDGAQVTVKAAAWENNPDGELDTSNNFAISSDEDSQQYLVSIPEDEPSFVDRCGNEIDSIRIMSDETPGRQPNTDETSLKHVDQDVKDVLAGLGLTDKPVSVADKTVRYDLKSDGAQDPNPVADPQSRIGFEVVNGTDSGWTTVPTADAPDGSPIYLYQLPDGNVVGSTMLIDDFDPANLPVGFADSIAMVVTVTGGEFNNGINSADITFIQYQPLNHPKGGDSHNETMGRGNSLGLDLVVYDEEGDKDSVKVNINVRDDGPGKGCVITDMIFENDLRAENGGVMVSDGALNTDFGADGAHYLNPVYWDAETIAAEFDVYKAMIDGEPKALSVTFEPAGSDAPTTFVVTAADGTEVAKGTISFDPATGQASYSYEQYQPLQHAESGLSDIFRKLDLKYVVQDGDGDTVTNDLKILVHDSNPRPSVGAGHVDETWAGRTDGDLNASYIPLSEFDYEAPDGLASVSWNETLTKAALNAMGLKAAGDAEPATIRIENGIVTFTDNQGNDFLWLELVEKDGQFYVKYTAEHGLAHYIGGLAHNDALVLPLVINSYDGDGDAAPNAVGLVITDDGPKPMISSNIELVDGIGSSLLEGLNNMFGGTLFDAIHKQVYDEWHQNQDLDLSGALEDLAAIGGGVAGAVTPEAILDLARLVINSGLLADNARTPEEIGQSTGSSLNVEYGLDGPATSHTKPAGWDAITGCAEPSPVGWSVAGVQSMLTLLGVRASQYPDAKLLVEAVGNTYPPTTLNVYVFDEDGNKKPVMQLDITHDNGLNAGYTITQFEGLYHDPDSLVNMLLDMVSKVGMDALESIIRDQLGDYAESFLKLLADPGALTDAIGSGELLHLPLPYVTMDGDGDITVNMVFHTIRDSEPVALDRTDNMELADDGGWVAVGNILTGDETTGENADKAVDYGADGKNLTEHLTMLGDNAVKTADGWEVQGEYGKLVIDGKTGEYRYELSDEGKQKLAAISQPEPEDPIGQYTKGDALEAGFVSAHTVSNLEGLIAIGSAFLTGQEVGFDELSQLLQDGTLHTANGLGVGVSSGLGANPSVNMLECLLINLGDMAGPNSNGSGTITLDLGLQKNGMLNPLGYVLAFDADGKVVGYQTLSSSMTFPESVASIAIVGGNPNVFGSGGFYITGITSTYTPGPDLPQESFDYSITDGDKDTDGGKLVIDLADGGPYVIDHTDKLTTDEGDITGKGSGTTFTGDEATNVDTGELTFVYFGDDDPVITIDGTVWDGAAIPTSDGLGKITNVVVTKDGQNYTVEYIYELTGAVTDSPVADDGRGEVQSSGGKFDIGVNGQEFEVKVAIHDDAPVLEFGTPKSAENPDGTDDMGTIMLGTSGSLTIDTFESGADGVDSIKLQYGADDSEFVIGVPGEGQDAGVWTFTLPNGTTVKLDSEGDLTVTAGTGTKDGNYKYTFTVTDKDGDTATDSIAFTVVSNPFKDFRPFVVDESYLDNQNAVGTLAGQGDPVDVQETTLNQTQIDALKISFTDSDGITHDMAITGTQGEGYSGTLAGDYGTMTFTAVWNESTGEYDVTTTYTLTDNFAEHRYNEAQPGDDGYNHHEPGQPVLEKDDWNESTADGLVGDAKPDSFNFTVGSESATVGTDILDDGLGAFTPQTDAVTVEEIPLGYNIVLCVDLSGSMLFTPANTEGLNNGPSVNAVKNETNGYGYEDTRLYTTQVAMIEMLLAYRAQVGENVTVDLIGFNTKLHQFGTQMSVTEAIQALCKMSSPAVLTFDEATGKVTGVEWTQENSWADAGGNTGYGHALNDVNGGVQELLNNALQNADEHTATRLYFVSDGAHNSGNFNQWGPYLEGTLKDADNFDMLAVGISDVGSMGSLADVAGTVGDTAFVPSDNPELLAEILYNTLGTAGEFTMPVGADGDIVLQEIAMNGTVLTLVDVDGDTGFPTDDHGKMLLYILTDGTASLTRPAEGDLLGTFVFGSDGKYSFSPNSEACGKLVDDVSLNFDLTFMDADGDTLKVDDGFVFTVKAADIEAVTVTISDLAVSEGMIETIGSAIQPEYVASEDFTNTATGTINAAMDSRLTLDEVTFKWGPEQGQSFTVTQVNDTFEIPGYGVITITSYDGQKGIVEYEFKLTGAQTADGDSSSLKLEVECGFNAEGVKVASGSDTGLSVTIYDDLPVIEIISGATGDHTGWNNHADDDDAVSLTQGKTSEGGLSYTYGADGEGKELVQVQNADGDYVTITDGLTVPVNGGSMAFTIADGKISYVFTATGAKGSVNNITFKVTDSDGDSAYDTLRVTIDHGKPTASLTVTDAVVHEAALPEWAEGTTLIQSEGTGVDWTSVNQAGTTTDVTASGTIELTDYTSVTVEIDGKTVTFNKGEEPANVATDHGKVSFTYDESTGNYTFEYTLTKAVSHTEVNVPGETADLAIKVTATGEGGITEAPATGTISVVDDQITASEPSISIEATAPTDYHVTLVVDVSPSMGQGSGSDYYNILPTVKEALTNLLNTYAAESNGGDVVVRMVTFHGSAKVLNGVEDIQSALQAIEELSTSGSSGTNYREALNQALGLVQQGLNDPAYEGYERKVYFVSDGDPNQGSMGGSYIPSAWTDFVNGSNAGDVDIYAVGVTGITTDKYLKQIVNQTEMNNPDIDGDNVFIIKDVNDLNETLGSTASTEKGNLLELLDAKAADGWDDIISFNGHPIDWPANGAPVDLTLDTGLTLRLWSNGDYLLKAENSFHGSKTFENVKIGLKDGDGDTIELTVDINAKSWIPSLEAVDKVGVPGDVEAVPVEYSQPVGDGTASLSMPSFGNTSDSVSLGMVVLASGDKLSFDFTKSGWGADDTTMKVILTDSTGGIITETVTGSPWTLSDENAAKISGGQYTVTIEASRSFGSFGSNVSVTGIAVISQGNVYHQTVEGNVITDTFYTGDEIAMGMKDELSNGDEIDAAKTSLTGVSIDGGAPIDFGNQDSIKVDLPDGTLTMYKDGRYDFTTNSFETEAEVSFSHDITYTVQTALTDKIVVSDTATLHLRSDDLLHEGTANDDNLTGTDGNDILFGGAGNDVIHGGAGDDILFGGIGNDELWGGDGADTFAWENLTSEYNGDHDKIMDFNIGDGDRLMFKDILGNGEGQLNISAKLDDGNMVLSLEKGDIAQTIEVVFDQGGIEWKGQSYDSLGEYVSAYNTANGASGEEQALKTLLDIMTATGN